LELGEGGLFEKYISNQELFGYERFIKRFHKYTKIKGYTIEIECFNDEFNISVLVDERYYGDKRKIIKQWLEHREKIFEQIHK
jgi:hypothetical protein